MYIFGGQGRVKVWKKIQGIVAGILLIWWFWLMGKTIKKDLGIEDDKEDNGRVHNRPKKE